jgi:hypothetical protein
MHILRMKNQLKAIIVQKDVAGMKTE